MARLRRALNEYAITGIKTNVGLFRRILSEPEFQRAEIHTKWLDEILHTSASGKASAAQDSADDAIDAAAIAAVIWQAIRNGATGTADRTPEPSSRLKQEGRRQQLDRTP